MGNIPEFEKIKNPYPDSGLNRRIPADMKDLEKNMPDRSLWQWILSENERNLDGNRPQYAQAVPQPRLEDLPQAVQKLYRSATEHLTAYHQKNNLPLDEERLKNAAMSIAALGYSETMGMGNGNPPLLFNVKNGQYIFGERNPGLIRAGIDIGQAEQTPFAESVSRTLQTERQFEQQELERQMAQSQSRGMSLS